jgi:hypothetical protein
VVELGFEGRGWCKAKFEWLEPALRLSRDFMVASCSSIGIEALILHILLQEVLDNVRLIPI